MAPRGRTSGSMIGCIRGCPCLACSQHPGRCCTASRQAMPVPKHTSHTGGRTAWDLMLPPRNALLRVRTRPKISTKLDERAALSLCTRLNRPSSPANAASGPLFSKQAGEDCAFRRYQRRFLIRPFEKPGKSGMVQKTQCPTHHLACSVISHPTFSCSLHLCPFRRPAVVFWELGAFACHLWETLIGPPAPVRPRLREHFHFRPVPATCLGRSSLIL